MNVKGVGRGFLALCGVCFSPVAYSWDDPLFAVPPTLSAKESAQADGQPQGCSSDQAFDARMAVDLWDSIDWALCHNPKLRGTWASIKVQAAQVGEARSAYLPSVVLGFSRLHQKTKTSNSEGEERQERSSETRNATLNWRLLDFGGRNANHRLAQALLDSAWAGHDAELQRTIPNVVELYFNAQIAKSNQASKEQNLVIAKKMLDMALRRESRGMGAQSDTLQAQTVLAKSELELMRATGEFQKALVGLGVAMGLPVSTLGMQTLNVADHDEVDQTSVHQELAVWLKQVQEQHPAIVSARAQVLAAKEKLILTRSEGLPTLDFTQSVYVNGRPNQGLTSQQTKESVSGFTLSIPLFDGFARTYKVQTARALVEQKEAELWNTELVVVGEVAKAYAEAMISLRSLEASERLFTFSQAALDKVSRKYDQGVADIVEMLGVQKTFTEAHQERLRVLAEWRSARLRLLSSAGVLEPKKLHPPVGAE